MQDCQFRRRGNRNLNAMFDFTWPEVVRERLPLFELAQILSDMPGEKNVTGISAIHDSLGKIQTRPARLVCPATSVTSLTGPL